MNCRLKGTSQSIAGRWWVRIQDREGPEGRCGSVGSRSGEWVWTDSSLSRKVTLTRPNIGANWTRNGLEANDDGDADGEDHSCSRNKRLLKSWSGGWAGCMPSSALESRETTRPSSVTEST